MFLNDDINKYQLKVDSDTKEPICPYCGSKSISYTKDVTIKLTYNVSSFDLDNKQLEIDYFDDEQLSSDKAHIICDRCKQEINIPYNMDILYK